IDLTMMRALRSVILDLGPMTPDALIRGVHIALVRLKIEKDKTNLVIGTRYAPPDSFERAAGVDWMVLPPDPEDGLFSQ
ncbi:hypothetical protein V5O48_005536, partial [Marasmius crinis-equi]